MKRLIPVLLLLCILLIFSGCDGDKDVPGNNEPNEKLPASEISGNLFDAKKVKTGDTIAGMEITSVDVGANYDGERYPASVQFKGEKAVSGEYVHHPVGHEFLGSLVAFYVDDETKNNLPKLKQDERYVWFVFSNQSDAAKAFGGPGSKGRADVLIDEYKINYAPSDVYNTAKLIKAVILEEPEAKPEENAGDTGFKLGNEVLISKYYHLIEGKKVGLVTNQSGVNSQGKSTVDLIAADPSASLAALYGPEHGIDGAATAGEYVKSYVHPQLGIPVYSLYGETRMPTAEMLSGIDVLLFDIQDIGARTYTYMSTLNYCMVAAQKYNKPVVVLDRPNPVGGVIVDGPVLEDPYITFVGVDNLPTAHGMTAGELARYFNRKIGADLKVVPMEGYTRKMIFQDTGLKWVQTSPNIPDIASVFGYMSTGLGEGTGVYQSDKFKWIGGKGIESNRFAELLNSAGLPGVTFVPENIGDAGGVRLKIEDYHTFNPAKTGIYALAYARSLNNFSVPKSGSTVVMFDKIMGTNKIGLYLEQGLTPQQIEANYAPALNKFKTERQQYLIYN